MTAFTAAVEIEWSDGRTETYRADQSVALQVSAAGIVSVWVGDHPAGGLRHVVSTSIESLRRWRLVGAPTPTDRQEKPS